jgi:hypothetical protein
MSDFDIKKVAATNPRVEIDKLRTATTLLEPLQKAGLLRRRGYTLTGPFSGKGRHAEANRARQLSRAKNDQSSKATSSSKPQT